MTAKGDFFPSRTNDHVPSMAYAADVRINGVGEIEIPALAAADTDGILDGTDIATAGSTTTFAAAYTGAEALMGKFGRNVTVVASGAATSTVTVTGKDYLGQVMVETLTLNGTSAVAGKKAFRTITSIAWGATASRTIDVGWGDALGLPYKVFSLETNLVDRAAASGAGTVVAGVATSTTQTATTGDPRGTWTPHASDLADGSKTYQLRAYCDRQNLHGNAHYAG
jgi:hypothetical protein